MTTYEQMRCEVCGVHMADVGTLHRANAKGEPGRWRCAPHLDAPPPDDVLAITDAVQLGVDPRTLDGVRVIE